MDVYAGVELGGTKVVCGLASAQGELYERVRLETQEPERTLPRIDQTLAELADEYGSFGGLGIGTFGPVALNVHDPGFGRIGQTPKLSWRGCDLLGYFRARYTVPVLLDTDVTAAAFGEALWGAAKGADTMVYVTVGTGIGAGALVGGRPLHGLMHPEVGHIRVPRAEGDDYPGCCVHHADCIEGLAAGPAIRARWGCELGELPADHEAYGQIAHYLAHLVVNAILFYSPQRVVLGGGVLSNRALYPLIRERVSGLLNGYVTAPGNDGAGDVGELIVAPGLGDDAGVLGAVAMLLTSGS